MRWFAGRFRLQGAMLLLFAPSSLAYKQAQRCMCSTRATPSQCQMAPAWPQTHRTTWRLASRAMHWLAGCRPSALGTAAISMACYAVTCLASTYGVLTPQRSLLSPIRCQATVERRTPTNNTAQKSPSAVKSAYRGLRLQASYCGCSMHSGSCLQREARTKARPGGVPHNRPVINIRTAGSRFAQCLCCFHCSTQHNSLHAGRPPRHASKCMRCSSIAPECATRSAGQLKAKQCCMAAVGSHTGHDSQRACDGRPDSSRMRGILCKAVTHKNHRSVQQPADMETTPWLWQLHVLVSAVHILTRGCCSKQFNPWDESGNKPPGQQGGVGGLFFAS